jgi:hypothetical protein
MEPTDKPPLKVRLFAPWTWAWRRFGYVTLAGAVVLLFGGIRSHYVSDYVVVNPSKTWLLNFVSDRGYLGARFVCGKSSSKTFLWWSSSVYVSQPIDPMENVLVPNRIDLRGFHLGCDGLNVFKPRYFGICFISYWYVTSALAFLTVWLFWKRRAA